MKEWTGPNLAGCAYYDSDRARIASPYISRTQRSESRTVGGPINNNEIRPSTSLREMNFHFMALLGKRTMQGQFHKPAERLGAIATSRAKVAERLSRSKLCVTEGLKVEFALSRRARGFQVALKTFA